MLFCKWRSPYYTKMIEYRKVITIWEIQSNQQF